GGRRGPVGRGGLGGGGVSPGGGAAARPAGGTPALRDAASRVAVQRACGELLARFAALVPGTRASSPVGPQASRLRCCYSGAAGRRPTSGRDARAPLRHEHGYVCVR